MNIENQEIDDREQFDDDNPERQLNDFCWDVECELNEEMTFPSLKINEKRKIIKQTLYLISHVNIHNRSELADIRNHVYQNNILPWLEKTFCTEEEQKDNIISNKLSDANKLVCAALLLFTNKIQREYGEQTALDLAEHIHLGFFSGCPNPSYHADSVLEKIKLLSMASRESASVSILSNSIAEGVVCDMNFWREQSDIDATFNNKSSIEIIRLLSVEASLAKYAVAKEYPLKNVFHMIEEAIIKVSNNPDLPPLVKIVAKGKLDGMHGVFSDKYKTRFQYDMSQQDMLHAKFSDFGSDEVLVAISPDVCASTRGGLINYIVDINGNMSEIADWQPDNELNISKEDALLLGVAHGASVRDILESSLNINLSEMSLESQKYLLRFAMEAGNDRYDRLTKVLSKFEKDDEKIELINAFLATRFGEDFGDSILSIVECAKPNESLEIIKIINKYREVSKQFGGLYYDFDPELAKSTEMAMNERLTDLLVASETVAKEGILKEDVSPRRNTDGYVNDGRYDIEVDSMDEIINVMQNFLKSQQIIQDILSDGDTIITKAVDVKDNLSLSSQTYRLANKKNGFIQLHVRKRGASSYDRYNEYGNTEGTEATISWLVDPVNPYRLPSLKDPNCISVRFDREGRLPGERPDSNDRSPIRDDGLISIDISSILGGSEVASSLPIRLGRIIAAGNNIRARKRGSENSLNHNTNYFDQKYGQADNFEKIVNYIVEKIERNYKKPTKSQLAEVAIDLCKMSQKLSSNNSSELFAS